MHELSGDTSYNGFCEYIILDVLDVKSMPDKVRCAVAKFPENRIDILVNSAGLIAHSDFVHMTEEEFDNVMNVSSSSALRPANTPYHISKWAVKGLT